MLNLLSIFVWVAVSPAAAAGPASALDQATDAADQALVDRVLDLRLASGRKLSTELAAVPRADLDVRAGVRRARELHKRQRGENGVEVEAVLEPAQLNALLQEVAGKYPVMLEKTRFLLPAPASPIVAVARAGGPSPDVRRDASDAPGWRHCQELQIRLAEQAAVSDLRQNLLVHLAPLRISPSEMLGQLWVREPRLRDALVAQSAAVRVGPPELLPEGVARAAITLTARDVLGLITAAAGSAGLQLDADIQSALLASVGEPLTVEGFGVAPEAPPHTAAAARRARPDMAPEPAVPDWIGRTLTARGTARASLPGASAAASEYKPRAQSEGSSDSRSDLAVKVARADAMRRLWLQIEPLPLPDGSRVGEALLASDSQEKVVSIEQAMLPAEPPALAPNGTATATLTIRLTKVWEILSKP